MTAFIAASIAVHAGLLLRDVRQTPLELPIGGRAQALQVSLASTPAPGRPDTDLAALESEPAARVDKPLLPVTQRKTPLTPKPAPTLHLVPPPNRPPTIVSANQPGPGAIARATPQASSVNVSQRVSAALQKHLARRFDYPWLARKRGWQGEVTLSLRIADDGHLSDWAVFKTSGYTLLDKSALKAAQAIDELPEARNLLNGRSLQLKIPVRYRLLDS